MVHSQNPSTTPSSSFQSATVSPMGSCEPAAVASLAIQDIMLPGQLPGQQQDMPSPADSVPDDFICPLSGRIMVDPVIVDSGQSYERESIASWLAAGNRVCPQTQQPLGHVQLYPNLSLRRLISSWYDANGLVLQAGGSRPGSGSSSSGQGSGLPILQDRTGSLACNDSTGGPRQSCMSLPVEVSSTSGQAALSPHGRQQQQQQQQQQQVLLIPQPVLSPHSVSPSSASTETWDWTSSIQRWTAPTLAAEPQGMSPRVWSGPQQKVPRPSASRMMRKSPSAGGQASSSHFSSIYSNDSPRSSSGLVSPRPPPYSDASSVDRCSDLPSPASSGSREASFSEHLSGVSVLELMGSLEIGARSSEGNRSQSREGAGGSEQEQVQWEEQRRRQSEVSDQLEVLQRKGAGAEERRAALHKLRAMVKDESSSRETLAAVGGVQVLADVILTSDDSVILEHAVTALLNTSLTASTHSSLLRDRAVEAIVHAMTTAGDAIEAEHGPRGESQGGQNWQSRIAQMQVVRENGAAALFSLSASSSAQEVIGRMEAIPPLCSLLPPTSLNSIRGRKDASLALYNLSLQSANQQAIIREGAVPVLVNMLVEYGKGVEEKAMAVLSNVARCLEGRAALVAAGGISNVVEALEAGSQRMQEDALNILLRLAVEGEPAWKDEIIQEGVIPSLNALAQSRSSRARSRATKLLSSLRSKHSAHSPIASPRSQLI